MKNFTITVSFQDLWFLSQVEEVDEFYAQGKSYEEALENLFSVVRNIRSIQKKVPRSFTDKKISFALSYPG